ncbi:MAG: 2-oxo acid dehydrogenase subunit E2 [Rhizobiaceae bacterium]
MDYIASPSTRAYAGRKGVDLNALARTTGRETLAREDVDRHLTGRSEHAAGAHTRYWEVDHAAYGPVREVPMSRISRIAADNLAAANTLIPQVTHHDRADLRALEEFRARQRSAAEGRGVRLTALAFHVMALTRCLRAFPRFNASLSTDGTMLILKDYVHIGIAVDTEHGLIVPVIRHADRKGLWRIAADIATLAARAKDRQLRPEDMGGASMTISNLGGIGGIGFTPIVNPPELAILGLSRAETVPVPEGEHWVPVPMVPLDLSYDHRVINGAAAARFLTFHARLIKEPRSLLV